eukprot:scaffold378213_cov23-Prasinocladus_malaysianus.AAC.1
MIDPVVRRSATSQVISHRFIFASAPALLGRNNRAHSRHACVNHTYTSKHTPVNMLPWLLAIGWQDGRS